MRIGAKLNFELLPRNVWPMIAFALKRNTKGQIPISKIKSNDRAYINKAEITD